MYILSDMCTDMGWKMERYVITIARGYGSGGRTLGKKLAAKFGIQYYDKELLDLTANLTGIGRQHFANADEQIMKSSLYRVASNVYRGISEQDESGITNENLFAYQAKVLEELAKYESFVVIGRCANYILRNHPRVIRVFVHAPIEKCVENLSDLSTLDHSGMVSLIRKTDSARAEYCYYHTGRVWNDVTNYDLVLDTGRLDMNQCVSLVEAYRDIVVGRTK